MTQIKETGISASDVGAGIQFHEHLNPRLWAGDEMRLDVRVTLLKTALAFAEFLDLPDLKVLDVIFTGSSAAYNYTDFSDLDVHLIINFDETACPDLAENFFNTKKSLWNERHDIFVRDYPVEIYVENSEGQGVTARGIYSLLRGAWIKKPSREEPSFDDSAVLAKTEHLASEIDAVLDHPRPLQAQVVALIGSIRRLRQAGLSEAGEFSVENLAFKALRNLGFMDRLHKARSAITDRDLSLESKQS